MKKTLAKRKISSPHSEPSDSEEESIADPKNALNEQEGSAEFNETVDLKKKNIVEPLELQQILVQINQSELDGIWAKMIEEHEQNQREIC